MRRIIALAASAAAAAAVLASPAHAGTYSTAGDCGPDGNPAAGVVQIGTGANGTPIFYVDDRNFALGNGLWAYQEDNGKANLQRVAGTAGVADKQLEAAGGDKDTCTDLAGAPTGTRGDKLIF
jgi:hypothetical protein